MGLFSSKSSSTNITQNTVSVGVDNIIDTDPIADVIEASNKSFINLTAQSLKSLQSLNATLGELAKGNDLDNQQQNQVLSVLVFLVGAGGSYYIFKKRKRGKSGK